tara:strand:+ start:1349 stop:1471 length:123 start_codon:yes stop_codon:yes gene_type:complete
MKRNVEIQIAKQPEGIAQPVSVQNIAQDNANPIMDKVTTV